ncbi:BapA/Bap/LapF family large adhesin [Acinetobacter chinensis]|nr:BapA/Bap/LapF family large adhesin [Acinetobacter chinensis]
MTGTGEPGATILVKDKDGNTIGSAVVDASGNYSAPLDTPLTNGEKVDVTATDAAGNESTPVEATAPDTTAPDAPTATVTPDGTAVTGTGEPGATILVKDKDGNTIGSAVVDASGNYSAPLDTPLTNGEKVDVTATDTAGNESTPVEATAPDSTAPDAPTATVTPDGTAVTGTGEPGATILVKDKDGNTIGSAVVDASGNYSAPLDTPLVDGEKVDVTATDAAGNESTPVEATAPDLFAPDAPTATVDQTAGDKVTGATEPGSTVTVYAADGVTVLGSATADASGNYTVNLATPLLNGEDVKVTAKDPGGESAPANAKASDQTPPDAPTAAIDQTLGNKVTGTGEPGATVLVKDQGGNTVGSAVVDASGNYTADLTKPFTDGESLAVTQTDSAGNESVPTNVTAPNVPMDAQDNSDTVNIEYDYPVTEKFLDNAITYSWLLGAFGIVLGTTKGSTEFTVGQGVTADVQLQIKSGSWASFLDQVSIVLSKYNPSTGQWDKIADNSSTGIFDFIGVFGEVAKVNLDDLSAGRYKIDMSSFNMLTLPGYVETDIAITEHHTSQTPIITTVGEATGNVITDVDPSTGKDNLAAGSVVTKVNGDTVSGATVITGLYGKLTINADGSYTYKPDANLANIGKSDVFSYTVTDPVTGKEDTADLTIDIGTTSGATVASLKMASAVADFDSVDADAGNTVTSTENDDQITLGNGTDTVIYNLLDAADATGGNGHDTVSEFTVAGASEQHSIVDIKGLLSDQTGVNAGNIGNYVKVAYNGTDTVISIDRDGTGANYSSADLLTLKNTNTTLAELLQNNQLLF